MRSSFRSSRAPLVVLLVLVLTGILLTVTGVQSGVPASVWSLKGNRGTDPGPEFLGTSDNEPLIIKTNSTPVMTLGSVGPVEVHKALVAHDDVSVEKDLRVDGSLTAAGGVTFSGPLAVGGSATIGGDLSVSGQAQFAQNAEVGGNLAVSGTATATAVTVSGTTTTGVLEVTGGDLAEPFEISGSSTIPAGAVVIIDDTESGQLSLSATEYDRRVAGVVSGAGGIRPGLVLYRQSPSAGQHVALAGRVYALADASKYPIRPGDLLTTSSDPGRLMKVTDYQRAQGAVVGKAMSTLETGKGLVLVLVSLQ